MSTSPVRIIKANPFNYKNVGTNEGEHLLRVAAYARVSTDSDEQEDSFERQVSYYTNLISSNPDWKFVQVYSDPGVTGTRADRRPGFMKMMEDCREGKIDKIFVKSLARFARNTVDALKYIRELKELGILYRFFLPLLLALEQRLSRVLLTYNRNGQNFHITFLLQSLF